MSIQNLAADFDISTDLETNTLKNASVSENHLHIAAHPAIRDFVDEIVKDETNDFKSLSQFVRTALREFVKQPLNRVNGENILELVPVGTATTNRHMVACVSNDLKKQVRYVKESPITPYSTYFEVGTVAIVWFSWKQNRA